MTNIRLDGEKSPLTHVLIIVLFAIGVVALPFDVLFKLFIEDERTCYFVSQAVPRVIFCIVALIFICKYNFNGAIKGFKGLGFLLIIPALLVCINNAPIIAYLQGNIKPNFSIGLIIAYLSYCIAVGFYEEIIFRGLVFPLCLIKLKNKKRGLFWAVVLSSAIFSLSHIVNLFAGMGIGAVILQLGYTFLIGAMCAIAVILTKNIFSAVFLHAVYDIGGLALMKINGLNGVFVGNQWDTLTIIVTAVLGVIVGVYMLILLLRQKDGEAKKIYNISEGENPSQLENKQEEEK